MNKKIKVVCMSAMCLFASAVIACPCGRDTCYCGDAQTFMNSNAEKLHKESKKLSRYSQHMNKNTSMTEQSSAMNEDIEFIMEQAEIIAKNGNVVMAYSEVIDENMFNIPSEKKYQAKMDAAKLIENGKRMQKLAEKRKEDALSRVTDEDVEAETIEYLDIIIDNANTIVASGELLQARIQ